MGHFVYVGDPVESFDDCCGRKRRKDEFDCCVKVTNSIDIRQDADANGGDGGEGGDNNSAAAAAASGGGVAVSVPVTVDVEEKNLFVPATDNGANGENDVAGSDEESSALQPPSSGQEIETEAEANAGNGGDGGDAEIKQSAYAKIDNWTVVVCGDDGKKKDWVRDLKFDTDGKEVNFKMDNDEIFVNGEKMDFKELKDGTKVYIVKQ